MDGVVIKMENRLQALLDAEKQVYFGDKPIKFDYKFRKKMNYEIYKYISLLRKYEYCCKKRDESNGLIASKLWVTRVKVYDRLKNKLGMQLGIEINPGFTKQGLRICHQNVIINGYVGEYCTFHGNNVIGNKRTGASDAVPKIGSHVDIGVGAMIIGDVEIADNCIIGAGAVVTKSFNKPGTIIAGVPAKEINLEKE